MAKYKYKARDKNGKLITGKADGDTESIAVDTLKKMGYVPVKVEEIKEAESFLKMEISLARKVSDEDMILFTRQMATLLKSGLPLLSGLDAVAEQTKSTMLKNALLRVKKDIESGTSFSEALAAHKDIFPPLYIGMVKTGEATGLLDSIMERLAELAEYDMDIKTKVKTAVRYPILTLGTLVVAFLVIVLFVVPRFITLFTQFKLTLPLPTRVLIGLYNFLHNFWYIAILLVAGAIFGFLKFVKTEKGRKLWDRFKISFPVFGPLLLKLYMARFTRTTSILIASGVNMLDTLDLTKEVVGNVIVRDAIENIRKGVNEGTGLASPVRATKLFPPIVIQMVTIGEETGKLDELLARASDHYDQQISYTMKNLTTLIEPMLLFILGIMVTVVALAVFLPLWDMVNIYKTKM